jgi:hypothetical protein
MKEKLCFVCIPDVSKNSRISLKMSQKWQHKWNPISLELSSNLTWKHMQMFCSDSVSYSQLLRQALCTYERNARNSLVNMCNIVHDIDVLSPLTTPFCQSQQPPFLNFFWANMLLLTCLDLTYYWISCENFTALEQSY